MGSGFQNGQIVELSIDTLAHGGAGVGRLNDFVFFIPFTAPGDTVTAKITEIKKNYAFATLQKIIKPSEFRVPPRCSVFGECGGCQWQHVSYSNQLIQKQKSVEHALQRIAKESDFQLKPIIRSPLPFNYRNRAQIKTEGPKAGFFKRESHEIVEFDTCHIVDNNLNLEIQKIKTEIKNYSKEKQSRIEMFISQNGKIIRSNDKGSGEEFGFSQVNTMQNQNMQNYILDVLGKAPITELEYDSRVLDLYCGNGNFSFPLDQNGWTVLGIDGNKSAINSAKSATEKNSKSKSMFLCDDCTQGTFKLLKSHKKYSTILLDPPRTGADEKLIKNLGKFGAKTLIYISCNPATFARDWARIKVETDFKLVSVQPFDMFPQTYHVELVALAKIQG